MSVTRFVHAIAIRRGEDVDSPRNHIFANQQGGHSKERYLGTVFLYIFYIIISAIDNL